MFSLWLIDHYTVKTCKAEKVSLPAIYTSIRAEIEWPATRSSCFTQARNFTEPIRYGWAPKWFRRLSSAPSLRVPNTTFNEHKLRSSWNSTLLRCYTVSTGKYLMKLFIVYFFSPVIFSNLVSNIFFGALCMYLYYTSLFSP